MSRKFGVEFEVIGNSSLGMEAAAALITRAGIPCFAESYGHSTPVNWKIVTDSSLSGGGFEVVSPILVGENGREQVKKVLTTLNSAGIRVDKSCGFHVHIDATGLSGASLANVAGRYALHETEIDSIMPRSRRGTFNMYCQSMTSVMGAILPFMLTDRSANALAGAVSNRSVKLNLTAYLRHNTVEFRQHSGTTDPLKALRWIDFCQNFVDNSIVRVVEVPAAIPDSAEIPAASRVVPNQGPTGTGSDGLRLNSEYRKFMKLARILDAANFTTVRYAALADGLGIPQNALAGLICRFRDRFPGASIRNVRGVGYYRSTRNGLSLEARIMGVPIESSQPLTTPSAATVPTRRFVAPDDLGPWAGLSQDATTYYRERAAEFSGQV